MRRDRYDSPGRSSDHVGRKSESALRDPRGEHGARRPHGGSRASKFYSSFDENRSTKAIKDDCISGGGDRHRGDSAARMRGNHVARSGEAFRISHVDRESELRTFRPGSARRIRKCVAGHAAEGNVSLVTPVDDMVSKVRHELAKYEHPLFDFEARNGAAAECVDVLIRFKPAREDVHEYIFQLR